MVKFGGLRYAHDQGIVHLAVDGSGEDKTILSAGGGGEECEVMRWTLDGDVDDDDPAVHTVSRTVTAIACFKDRVAVGNDRYQVESFATGEEGDWTKDVLLTRFTTPPTALAYSSDGKRLLAASSDFNLKWVSVEDQSYVALRGHSAPVLSVALAADGRHCASSSCDGSVRLWALPAEDAADARPEPCATLDGLWAKSNDVSAERTLARLAFHPGSGELVVPVAGRLNVYSVPQGKLLRSLPTPSVEHELSTLAVHPSGRVVAAASLRGDFDVWDWASGVLIWTGRHSDAQTDLTPTALLWHPGKEAELVFTLADGRISHIRSIPMDEGQAAAIHETESAVVLDEDDESRSSDLGALKKNMGFDPDGSFVANGPPKSSAEVVDLEPPPRTVYKSEPSWKPLKAHPCFVSGSTPEGRAERYLKWNGVGIVRGLEPADEAGTIEVEFHDSAVHHPYSFDNGLGYSMADVSEEALALAAPAGPSDAARLTLQYLAAWDHESRSWTADLPKGEEPLGLGLGEGFVALATSARLIRLWTLGGMERFVWAFAGRLVSLAARGDQIAIVTEDSLGPGGQEHRLCLSVFRVPPLDRLGRSQTRPVVQNLPLPLSPKGEEDESPTELVWLGLTEVGSPVTVDSAGWVRLLNLHTGQTWTPICSLNSYATGRSDNYWPVEVREAESLVRAIMCKASSQPYFVPRPIVGTLDWTLPLCETEAERSGKEAELFGLGLRLDAVAREAGLSGREVEEEEGWLAGRKAERKALLLLFSQAVKAERERRAVELAQLMPDSQGVQALIRYATKLRKAGLVERLGRVALAKDEAAAAATADVDEEEENREPRPQSASRQTVEEEQSLRPSGKVRLKPRAVPSTPLAEDSFADSSLNASSLMGDPPTPSSAGPRGNPFKRKAPDSATQRSAYDVFDSQEPTSKRPGH